ncbi:MAG: flagellar filament capping protein FliD [Clostridia bacterium]|nr:flagellar filament capping protein FliD [Clostridia bacterium]
MAVNRITGLATGMDTDALIEQLMSASRAPLTKLEQKNTKIEWQRQAMLDINSKLLSFRTAALDMKLQGTYKSYTATSSNSNLVSASATTEAEEGVYTFKVSQLATKTTLEGRAITEQIKSSEGFAIGALDVAGKEFYINFNGEKKKISFGESESYNAPADLASALQSKVDDTFGANQIKVTQVTLSGKTTLRFESDSALNLPVTVASSETAEKDFLSAVNIKDGSTTSFSLSSRIGDLMSSGFDAEGNFTISVRDREFTFNKDQTLSDVFNTINKAEDLDVTARYDSVNRKVVFERSSTGDGKDLKIGGSRQFWSALKMSTTQAAVSGQNAKFDITTPDGQTVKDVEMASNSFTYKGVTATLLNANPDEMVSVTVSKNVDAVYEKIENFVNSYNDLLVSLNKAYNEETTGYDPLTDEERESLSDTQQEQWEEKAKQGILRRDSTIKSTITSLRSAVTSYVSGSGISSLFQIGISTTQYDSVNSENNGKLVIDKDKLKEAITNDIDGVTSLFTNTAKQIQGNKLSDTNLNLDGKSFTVTYGGSTKTITLEGSYDLSNASSASDFEDYMKEKFASAFGEGCISVSYSGGKLLFNSLKNVNMSFQAGSDGNDALSLFNVADGAKYDNNERGFAVKIYDICTTSMNSIIDKAGSTSTILDESDLGKKMKQIKQSIATQQERLERLEERYYSQFAAMEEAINNMNSQSSYLQSMLNGG